MHGKTIKVEEARKPYAGSSSKCRMPRLSRNREPVRSARRGRGENGGVGAHPSSGGPLGNVLKYKTAPMRLKISEFQ